MSSRLSHHQHEQLLKAIEEMHACRDLEQFPATINRLFLRLIGCDSVSYNEVYPAMDRAVALMEPEPEDFDASLQKWRQYAHQHPLIRYMRETGDGAAHQIADFLSKRDYHALDLYQEVYRKMQVEHQMAVTVIAPKDIIVAVALNRQRGRFSETARLVANCLRPHVSRAYLNLVELQHLTAMVDGLGGALEESATAVVLWSQREIVLHASRRAREILTRFFGWREGRHLPETLAAWARTRQRHVDAPEVFLTERAKRQLEVRLAPRPELHYTTLHLTEKTAEPDPAQFRALGLSPRQTEVIAWLTEGKSNDEIALILGMNPLTVKTHIAQILRKLGVENRTTAVARALEISRKG